MPYYEFSGAFDLSLTPQKTFYENIQMNRDIFNKELFKDKVDFGLLNKALPGKCGFTDIDAVIERNGHFLWVESKRSKDSINRGQSILFTQLHKRGDSVLWLYGPINEWTSFDLWCPNGYKLEYDSIRSLELTINQWWEYANEAK